MFSASDVQAGHAFQDAVAKLFRIEDIPWQAAYRRAEAEVDGAAEVDGWYYLVEARWLRRPAGWKDFDAPQSNGPKIWPQAIGLFVFMAGWMPSAAQTLRARGGPSVVLMNQHDIAAVLTGTHHLVNLLRAKARRLALHGEPYWPAP